MTIASLAFILSYNGLQNSGRGTEGEGARNTALYRHTTLSVSRMVNTLGSLPTVDTVDGNSVLETLVELTHDISSHSPLLRGWKVIMWLVPLATRLLPEAARGKPIVVTLLNNKITKHKQQLQNIIMTADVPSTPSSRKLPALLEFARNQGQGIAQKPKPAPFLPLHGRKATFCHSCMATQACGSCSILILGQLCLAWLPESS